MADELRASAIRFDRASKTTRRVAIADLEIEAASEQSFLWIDLEGPDPGVLQETLRRLRVDLPPPANFARSEVLPRILEQQDCLAFDLYEVEDPEQHLDTTQGLRLISSVRMIVVLGERFVVTYHVHDLALVRHVRGISEESFRAWGKTPGFIAFLLLQRCLYDYAEMNLASDNYLDQLDKLVLEGDPRQLAQEVSVARRNILMLKKLCASLEIVLMVLANKRSLFVSEESRAFYQEMLRNATSVRSAIDSSRDLLDGIVGSIEADASRRTGDVARVLTIVSTVMLPLTLITGIYGMNFQGMPELSLRWGYPAALGLMAGISLATIWAFRRLGWIGRGAR